MQGSFLGAGHCIIGHHSLRRTLVHHNFLSSVAMGVKVKQLDFEIQKNCKNVVKIISCKNLYLLIKVLSVEVFNATGDNKSYSAGSIKISQPLVWFSYLGAFL